MDALRRFVRRLTPPPRPRFDMGEFLGRPARACRFSAQRVVIGYVDRDGCPSFRTISVDEVLDQNGHRYLSAYCHERFDRRHFRLDRVTFLHRFGTGEAVAPAAEVDRWTVGA